MQEGSIGRTLLIVAASFFVTSSLAAAGGTATGFAVLPTTSVDELFAAREAWGQGAPAKDVEAPLAAGAVSPLPEDKMEVPKGFEGEPTIHALDEKPVPQMTPVAQNQLEATLKAVLTQRENWIKNTNAPGKSSAAATAETKADEKPNANAASGGSGDYAVLPTTDVDELFAAREAWGKGPDAKAVEAPLATGAYSPLPADKMDVPKGFEGEPTIHAFQETPVPQLTSVPQAQLDDAMKSLLAERESWGTAPSNASASAGSMPAASDGSEYAVLPTTNVDALFAAREAWGQGAPAKDVEAPLAAGSVSPLPEDKMEAPKGFDGDPTVHAYQETPVPQLTPVPQAQLEDATKSLLANRESWGTEPSASSSESSQKTPATQTAAATPEAAGTAGRSAEATDCEANLRKAIESGVIRFAPNSVSFDTDSNTTLESLAKIAKSCTKGRIRVEGHTDSTGRAAFNKALSEKRAQAVADYLSQAGVDANRIEAIGYGQEKPIAANNTREGRAKNRRIEFTVVE
ncbi:MAG: OmpA family protein [Hyphomicrobiaceae bacterium]